jgi:hypothetical protein
LPASDEYEKPPKNGVGSGGLGGGGGGGGLGLGLGYGMTLSARAQVARAGGFWSAEGGSGGSVAINNVNAVLRLPPKFAAVVGLTVGWPQKVMRAAFLGRAGASARA